MELISGFHSEVQRPLRYLPEMMVIIVNISNWFYSHAPDPKCGVHDASA